MEHFLNGYFLINRLMADYRNDSSLNRIRFGFLVTEDAGELIFFVSSK